MKRLGSLSVIRKTAEECKRRCETQGVPFHADALAAALGISYETLVGYAAGTGTAAEILSAALQECTASVLSFAMSADAKHHALYMWYLRNRGGFSDKGGTALVSDSGVTFIGEGRI